MSTIGGNNSIQDGLVFAYDTGNRLKSFPGEPTTNIAANYQQAQITYGDQSGDFIFQDAPEKGPRWKKVRILRTHSNRYLCKLPYRNHPDLETRTYSLEYDFNGHDDIFDWNIGGYGASVNEVHDGNYVYGTYTPVDGGGSLSFILSMGNNLPYDADVDYTIYYRDYQVEQKPHPTPFTPNTRTVTDSLLDLTKNTTIDVTNTSFDSEGQMFFDGVDDYVDLGSDIIFKPTGGWSIENITKFNTVPQGYNNVTSPGNFIGSDAITYNSWYWSVMNNKLALWNKSPGVWKYGSTIIQPNQYYHTVITCSPDGTSYQMYLNGEPEGGDHVAYSWNPTYAGLIVRYIGTGTPNVRVLDGSRPITKIYNKVLTPQEVKRNFQGIRSRFNI